MSEIVPLRILVVDNQSPCEDTASLSMRRWGNDVLTVFGGWFQMIEACEFAPDLVIVHVDNPEFDAVRLVKRFRRRHTFGSVPLIAMSAERDAKSRSNGLAAGFDGWLEKPISSDDLSRLFSEVRATISMPGGLAQRTIDQVALFDALKLEQDQKRRAECSKQP